MHKHLRYSESPDIRSSPSSEAGVETLDQMRKGTTTLAILKLLADTGEPMHGYQIIQALESRGGNHFQFKEGLIYPRLHQMEQENLLESLWIGEPGTRRRKVYRVTEEGRSRLHDELRRWSEFRAGMHRLLGLDGTASS
jgi:DNA-binding PadR family transcriptional regulator